MTHCPHKVLVLVPEREQRVRCTLCHLTISRDELGQGHCPECYAERGERRYDFEEVKEEGDAPVRYRCERCNLLIEAEKPI